VNLVSWCYLFLCGPRREALIAVSLSTGNPFEPERGKRLEMNTGNVHEDGKSWEV
jgi:hypothetical protein